MLKKQYGSMKIHPAQLTAVDTKSFVLLAAQIVDESPATDCAQPDSQILRSAADFYHSLFIALDFGLSFNSVQPISGL